MKRKEISIREWQKMFADNAFIYPDRTTQIAAGWYDWFCDDDKLADKTFKLGKVISRLKDGGKADLDTHYVFFKNNCPMVGAFYDDFRICDRVTGDVIYCISNRNRKWQVYDVKNWNEDDSPHFEGTLLAVVKYLNTKA